MCMQERAPGHGLGLFRVVRDADSSQEANVVKSHHNVTMTAFNYRVGKTT